MLVPDNTAAVAVTSLLWPSVALGLEELGLSLAKGSVAVAGLGVQTPWALGSCELTQVSTQFSLGVTTSPPSPHQAQLFLVETWW